MFRITIPTRHAAVVYHAGQLVGVLPAGRTRRRWGHRYVLVDLRERQQVIPPQDIPTADGLGVRVSAVARWAITDPVAFLEVSQTPADTLHFATQLALREAVGRARRGRPRRRPAAAGRHGGGRRGYPSGRHRDARSGGA
jgi:regulator of protease activity HflC (stomatin/prohibitin superfamily)